MEGDFSMIDLSIHQEGLAHNIACARKNGIVIPTFAQMKDPSLIPRNILDKLAVTGLWDIDPVNLFRVSWHNEPKESGGLFGAPKLGAMGVALATSLSRLIELAGCFIVSARSKDIKLKFRYMFIRNKLLFKDFLRLFCILRHNFYKTSCFRIHSCFPHHFWLIFTKTFTSLN